MTAPFDLVVTNARVVTCDGPDGAPAGARLAIVERGAVAMREGMVAYVGESSPALAREAGEVIDARGGVVLPGLVDPHTHLVFAGSRVDEFARRMAGEDYRAIAQAGGGIAATVKATRAASDEALFDLAARRARAMRAHGVTSIEVKSGYGLTLDDELRLLRVARRLEADGVARIGATFLGAHAMPSERAGDRAGYVCEIVEHMIPAVARERLADSVDAYIDDGAFTLAEGRAVLEAGARAGMRVRAHVGQFADLGGAELVAELGGLSADHLEEVSDAGTRALADAGVVAVLLPGAWRTLRQSAPDAARFRAAGVRLAVGTDLNPGTSPCTDLPLCAALAVRDAGMTLEEAVLAITVDAARAAGLDDVGRIRVGARADVAVYEHDDARAVAYGLGDVRPWLVAAMGAVVHRADRDDAVVW